MTERGLVIAFQTTTQALAWERACRERNMPGRLIPMPVAISAHCGLAWLAEPEDRESLLVMAEELGLGYDLVVELEGGEADG